MKIDRRWYWTAGRKRLVPHGHPDARLLAFPRGQDIPDRLADRVGLKAAVEEFSVTKQAAAPENKMAAAPDNKSKRIVSTRPPVSGPGSGVEAWRKYAVEATGQPAELFADLPREEIIDYMDAQE